MRDDFVVVNIDEIDLLTSRFRLCSFVCGVVCSSARTDFRFDCLLCPFVSFWGFLLLLRFCCNIFFLKKKNSHTVTCRALDSWCHCVARATAPRRTRRRFASVKKNRLCVALRALLCVCSAGATVQEAAHDRIPELLHRVAPRGNARAVAARARAAQRSRRSSLVCVCCCDVACAAPPAHRCCALQTPLDVLSIDKAQLKAFFDRFVYFGAVTKMPVRFFLVNTLVKTKLTA